MWRQLSARHCLVGGALIAAFGVSLAIEPPKSAAPAEIGIDRIVPPEFGSWRIDPRATAIVSPDVQAGLAKVYAETLTRTYVNGRGERIMLSIAYTGDIDRRMDVHRPEFCYPAQGFELVRGTEDGAVEIGAGALPVRRLVAQQGRRVEPITYWITVGEQSASSGWRRKFTRLGYALTGALPDGMLIRVSSISNDHGAAFAIHEDFVQDLVGALPDRTRARFVGAVGSSRG
jgi:EpsI family protein